MPRPFKCEICKKSYAVKDSLDAHIKGCKERYNARLKNIVKSRGVIK